MLTIHRLQPPPLFRKDLCHFPRRSRYLYGLRLQFLQACTTARLWRNRGANAIPLSLNLAQYQNVDLAGVEELLAWQLNARWLACLPVTCSCVSPAACLYSQNEDPSGTIRVVKNTNL